MHPEYSQRFTFSIFCYVTALFQNGLNLLLLLLLLLGMMQQALIIIWQLFTILLLTSQAHFQVSPEIFDWVQSQALAGPLKNIHSVV